MLKVQDIRADVEEVLRKARKGKGDVPQFLTAYQILDRLPEELRDRLIQERGLGGKGAGVHYAAPSLVSDAAESITGVEVAYLDTGGIELSVAGRKIEAGNGVAGLYRVGE